jgi:hypothetical protein
METLAVDPDDIDPSVFSFFFSFGFAAAWLPAIDPFDICPLDICPLDICPLDIDAFDIDPFDIDPFDIDPLDICPAAPALLGDCAKPVPVRAAPMINAAPAMVA